MNNAISFPLHQRVLARITDCLELASKAYSVDFDFPTVDYNCRGNTAGKAYCLQNRVSFNRILFEENVDHFIQQTVAHEVAHIVTRIVYGPRVRSHGREWKTVMMLFGIPADRCHDYDTTNSQVKIKNKYEYVCKDCGHTLFLGPVRHRKAQRFAMMGSNAYCHPKCKYRANKGRLTFKQALGQVTYDEARSGKNNFRLNNKAKTPKTPRAGSKAERALELVRIHYGHDRDAIVSLIIEKLNMSKAGATTYYYNAMRTIRG